MRFLVTRPDPDAGATVARLKALGIDAVAVPLLECTTLTAILPAPDGLAAIALTSANALRGIEARLQNSPLLKLPLFAVGKHTAQAARAAGFANVISADSDAEGLRERILGSVKAKTLKKTSRLLYLAGADLSRDLSGELGERGFTVVTRTTYRMAAVADLPEESRKAFATDAVEAVLHYSRRSARAFIDAIRAAGVEVSALSLPQYCLSAAIATVLRDAGAMRVVVAASPDEDALFAALVERI